MAHDASVASPSTKSPTIDCFPDKVPPIEHAIRPPPTWVPLGIFSRNLALWR